MKPAIDRIVIDTSPAAAFGRLCVETHNAVYDEENDLAAAFGRLCVETQLFIHCLGNKWRSRLRAAVC